MLISRRCALGALLIGTLTLSACGGLRDSRVNPLNWFGGSEETEVALPEDYNPLIPEEEDRGTIIFGGNRDEQQEDRSVAITRINGLQIDRTNSGAIIVATGEAKRLGAYDAALVRDADSAPGTLSYVFRVTYPENPTFVGSEATRTIRAAASISRQELNAVRTIRVEGQENARESRR